MATLTRRTCVTTLLLGSGLSAAGVSAQKLPPLKLGIMPFNSTLALIKTHRPLLQHLETALGRNVIVYTSTDYFTYVNELLDGHFDLAIAGPHFGVMSQSRGMTILTRYKADLQPVFVVKVGSSIQTLSDLKGKRVGLSSRLSISSIGGVKWLQDQGLILNQDYQLLERSTHGAAVAAVAVGELDAALTTHTPLNQIPEDVRAKIRVMPLDIHTPHLMTLAHARLGTVDIARTRQALQGFPDTPAGRMFFKETGYEGYCDVTASDLAQLRPFIDLTVAMMRQGK